MSTCQSVTNVVRGDLWDSPARLDFPPKKSVSLVPWYLTEVQYNIIMRALAPHWTFQTVEWSRKVASVHSDLRHAATHFVLPNLPGIITPDLESEFHQATTPSSRIVTVVAAQHTRNTLQEWVHEHSNEYNILLIVGGNAKSSTSLSSAQAIETVKQASTQHEVWAVANPNDKKSIDNVLEKVEAGATGIITQPLLSSHAMQALDNYPRHDDEITYLAGLALPKTAKSLYFWLNLLEQPGLVEDSLFCDYLEYFESRQDSLAWCRSQLSTLAKDAHVDGIHYMPVNNTADLLSLFGNK